MSIVADPPTCVLLASGGFSSHKLQNGTAERLVFKIKSSNNADYRVTPVFGFIDPFGSKEIKVDRLGGAPKEDRAVVSFAPAPADATDATAAFANLAPIGSITIPLAAIV